jgi:hypothetical protein
VQAVGLVQHDAAAAIVESERHVDQNAQSRPHSGLALRRHEQQHESAAAGTQELAAERGWLSNATDIGPASATPAAWLSVRDSLVNATVRPNAPIARMVGCVVTGEDVDTGLPVSVAAQSQLALTWPDYPVEPRLVSYTFPIAPSALTDYWRKCNTDADCVGAPAGGQCLCALFTGCKADSAICL